MHEKQAFYTGFRVKDAAGTPLSIGQKTEYFLRNTPRNRRDAGSVKTYYERGLGLIVEFYEQQFAKKNLAERDEFLERVNNLTFTPWNPIFKTTPLAERDGKLGFRTGDAVIYPKSRIAGSIMQLEKEMEVAESKWPKGLIDQRTDLQLALNHVSRKNDDHLQTLLYDKWQREAAGIEGTRSEYSAKFHHLEEIGLFADHPELQRYVSLMYAAQVHRDNAVQQIRHAVISTIVNKQGARIIPGAPEAMIKKYLSNELLGYLDYQTTRAREIEEAAKAYAHSLGIDEPQQQVLNDLAFLRRGTLLNGEFKQLLTPLADTVKQARSDTKEWKNVFAVRDFLLTYLPEMFPKWRQPNQKGITFATLEQLESNIHQIPTNDIPLPYRKLFLEREQTKLQSMAERNRQERLAVEEAILTLKRRQFVQETLFTSFVKKNNLPASEHAVWESFDPTQPISTKNFLPIPWQKAPWGYQTRYVYSSYYSDKNLLVLQTKSQPHHFFGNTTPFRLVSILETLIKENIVAITPESIQQAFADKTEQMETLGMQEKDIQRTLKELCAANNDRTPLLLNIVNYL